MQSRSARRGLLIVFGAVAVTLLAAAVGWACTWPVGQTEIVSPDDGDVEVGETLQARAEVWSTAEGAQLYGESTSFFGEDGSPCGNDPDGPLDTDAECNYDLGIVNPKDYDQHGHSHTCHYETPESYEFDDTTGDIEFAVIDDDPTHAPLPDSPGLREVVGEGVVPQKDAGNQTMKTGETVVCFYSSEAIDEGSPLNGRKNGAAAATLPAPIVVVD